MIEHPEGQGAPDISPADFELARAIAKTLRPGTWGEAQAEAFEADLAQLVWANAWIFRHTLDPQEAVRRRARMADSRTKYQRNAEVLEAAAALIPEEACFVANGLHWAAEYATTPEQDPAPITRAADALLHSPDPFPIKRVLLALARAQRLQAHCMTVGLKARNRYADDALIEWLEDTFSKHGLSATGYYDNFTGRARGTLVIACAMLRGEDPDEARWAVRAVERVRANRIRPPNPEWFPPLELAAIVSPVRSG